MAVAREAAGKSEVLKQAAVLLGGDRLLGRKVRSPLDAHELIVDGLPARALIHLIEQIEVLDRTVSLEKGVGMSVRTFQRHMDAPGKPLTQDQGGRAWKFAEVLARTTELLGSQQEAERWLEQPAIGLDGRRPLDLLPTPAGAELVEEFLTRLEYGVYV